MEDILHQAEQSEKNYDWVRAAESYEKALNCLSEDDFSRKSDYTERLSFAFYRTAFQAESKDEFRGRLRRAILSYQQAGELYGKSDDVLKTARVRRCEAMVTLASYWLAEQVSEKKRLLDECWELTKNSLEASRARNTTDFGKTFNELSTSVDLGYNFRDSFQAREKMIREAVELGERAIQMLSTLGDCLELSRAYAKTALYKVMFSYYFADLEDKEKCSQKAADYWLKAKEISPETAALELPSVLFGWGPGGYWGDGTDNAMNNFEKALECSWKTRDRFMIGRALDLLAYHNGWRTGSTEDPEKKTALQKRALQNAEDAKRQYSTISFTSPRGGVNWAEAAYLWYDLGLANRETDLNRKRELLGKALEVAPDMLKLAENSGYLDSVQDVEGMFSRGLRELARFEANAEEKKKLLEKALAHNKTFAALMERTQPLAYWNIAMGRGDSILIRRELADITKEREDKKRVLQEILSDSEDGLGILVKGLKWQFPGEAAEPNLGVVALWEFYNGNLLSELQELTGDREYLKKAVEAFMRGIQVYQETNQTTRLAESFWKLAQTYDALNEHVKSADNFDHASESYSSAAEKIPQLRDFYQNHAFYMQAWCEIEKARHDHERQEYGSAMEHFQKAAELHKSLKKWSYLEPNYSAWAQVEKAEELSRKEQSEDAAEAFGQASRLFSDVRKSLQTWPGKIEDIDEKRMVAGLIRASDLRKEYCEGRIALEEAKIFDKKGDHYSSSGKYGLAADGFEKMSQKSESEQDRKELELIIGLSRAWQKMTLAEARSSAALYVEASQIFEQAEDLSPNEKTKLLVLGHSRFCKALEAGTRFADSRDPILHQIAEQQLESAANYYVKAGFESASEYSKATGYLFDAYLYMDEAKKEREPEKKAKLYTMTEKVLQTSAGCFMKAEHPEKREQVLRLLDKVREEKELALSLSEVLHAPSIVSATTAFAAITPNKENAVGLERFENADIQANLTIRQKEVKVGELLSLKIELVNAGKGPAMLVKVNEVIPEGFELTEKPETCRVEDSYIDMKGKRLGPLKTEELKLVLKPKVQGEFVLKPTVLYLDENGKYKSHEPESVTIVVKELGIKGWLKGER